MKNIKMVTGLVLIDAPASALNNAGIEPGILVENKVIVKKIRKGREEYPYVSGQAFKRWWRDTIHQRYAWFPSPITREEKVAYTEANPIKYQEDDIFGYMLALARGEEKGLVYRRIAPLKCTPLISLFSNVITDDFAVFARGPAEAEPVPYEQEFYSTVLKGAFSLMLNEVGVFQQGKAKDLPHPEDVKEMRREGKREEAFRQKVDAILESAKKEGANIDIQNALIILPQDVRKRRIKETLLALSNLTGGAKLANYLTDVSPKFIIAAIISCANHIFMDVINIKDGKPILDIDALGEVLADHRNNLLSPVFIGLRRGFFDDNQYNRISQISNLQIEGGQIPIVFGSPQKAINELTQYIDKIDL